MRTIKKYFRGDVVALLTVLAVFAALILGLGYASGYGVSSGEGQVTYTRHSLFKDMQMDYRRDGGEWSFGYFVPIVVLALFWYRRTEILKTPVKPDLVLGGLILTLGFLIYWAGYRGYQKYFGYAAGQIIVAGAVVWFLGTQWFRKIFWLWALLGMMWPWRFLIERVSAPLQLVLSQLTAAFLNLVGVGAETSGSKVLTQSKDPTNGEFISLDIDVACSGMRSLFALVMIGLVFAFLRVREDPKRWMLMLLVPIVAVAGNFVRMLILYAGCRIWGADFAIGRDHQMSPYHMLAGLAVFAVALVLMSLLTEFLDKGWSFFKRSRTVCRSISST